MECRDQIRAEQERRGDRVSDNISRQAVLSILNGFEVMDGHTDQQRAIHMVELLPSTDRTGHWIQKDYYDMDWNVYECDQCGEPWRLETGTPKDNNMNFCPHCGADMRGVDDESTL